MTSGIHARFVPHNAKGIAGFAHRFAAPHRARLLQASACRQPQNFGHRLRPVSQHVLQEGDGLRSLSRRRLALPLLRAVARGALAGGFRLPLLPVSCPNLTGQIS